MAAIAEPMPAPKTASVACKAKFRARNRKKLNKKHMNKFLHEKAVAVSGVCSGGSRGNLQESPGKIAGKFFPNREMLKTLAFWAPGKADLPGTLCRHCLGLVPTFRAACFLKSTVPAFSIFSEKKKATHKQI